MKELIDKLTSYNFFNYLLPGVLFVVILARFTAYPFAFILDNLIVGAFICYFIGLVISRFGSLFIEPLLKKISFIKFRDYSDFVLSSHKDTKIETLVESSNMYRTICSMVFLIVAFKAYELAEFKIQILHLWGPYILIGSLLAMFLFSYRKQTEYISKRIDICKKS